MNIHIQQHTLLNEVQTQFSKTFSHLSLQFFIDKNNDGNLTADEKILNDQLTFGGLCKKELDIELVIEAEMTSKHVEQLIYDKVGIIAQVFRKRGDQWLMTTSSDDQTLEALNQHSIDLESPIKEEDTVDAADRMELE
jgi:hypothetical protein